MSAFIDGTWGLGVGVRSLLACLEFTLDFQLVCQQCKSQPRFSPHYFSHSPPLSISYIDGKKNQTIKESNKMMTKLLT